MGVSEYSNCKAVCSTVDARETKEAVLKLGVGGGRELEECEMQYSSIKEEFLVTARLPGRCFTFTFIQ